MIQFPYIANCTVFPLPESTALEFKAGFMSSPKEKIIATLYGFLNNGGGHLVIGVADDTRKIIGITENKIMDKFILMLDSIYHQHRLKKIDGSTVPIGTIKVETVEAANNKKVLVVSANSEPGEKYTVNDGTIWYRLAGSNYKQTTISTIYSEEELNAILAKKLASQKALLEKTFELKMTQLNQKAQKAQFEHDTIKNRFKELENDLQLVVQVAKQTENNLQNTIDTAKQSNYKFQEFRDMLYTDIQLKKAEAEQRLAQEKACNSWFSSIISYFY
jgi:predicted HTH transcriptional regulator